MMTTTDDSHDVNDMAQGTITKSMTADPTVTMRAATREQQQRHPNWDRGMFLLLLLCLF
jgi:hypothetical protein